MFNSSLDKSKLQNYVNTLKLNENFAEIIKKLIIDKNLESSTQILDSIKDKNQQSMYFAVAILNCNINIVKYYVEKIKISTLELLTINPYSVFPEYSNTQNINNKESVLIEIPLMILASIGGDVEIFNYLIAQGADVYQIGHILFSPKRKNSVCSNVIAAASYYGNHNLLMYMLSKNTNIAKEFNNKSSKLFINFKAQERKVKNMAFAKEYSFLTPIMLTTINVNNHDNSFKCFNILSKKSDYVLITDIDGNNLLHLAIKSLNFEITKTIIEENKINIMDQNNDKKNIFIIFDEMSDRHKNSNNYNNIKIILKKLEEDINKNTENKITSLIEDEKNKQNKKSKIKNKKKKTINNHDDTSEYYSNFQESNLSSNILKPKIIDSDNESKTSEELKVNIDNTNTSFKDNINNNINSNKNYEKNYTHKGLYYSNYQKDNYSNYNNYKYNNYNSRYSNYYKFDNSNNYKHRYNRLDKDNIKYNSNKTAYNTNENIDKKPQHDCSNQVEIFNNEALNNKNKPDKDELTVDESNKQSKLSNKNTLENKDLNENLSQSNKDKTDNNSDIENIIFDYKTRYIENNYNDILSNNKNNNNTIEDNNGYSINDFDTDNINSYIVIFYLYN